MSVNQGAAIAARANSQIGTPFRLRGRTAGVALDCVGLAAHALGIENPPDRYSLKGIKSDLIYSYLVQLNLFMVQATTRPKMGDLAVVQCADRQYHLMVAVEDGWVHAHAGLGKVVHMAGLSPWPIMALWRTKEI